ncbi:MAG: riboflavin synthase [Bacteroidota bacterium]
MFTGIIEQKGIVTEVKIQGTNRTFRISSPISAELKVDQSLSHDGVCLTIEAVENDCHQVTAIFETLQKTTLGNWETGTVINLERCMQLNGRLDGHIVQGHVDTTAVCTAAIEKDGSWEFEFKIDDSFGNQIIEKGSIAINGISLTLFNVGLNSFKVAIIPFTYNHTNLNFLKPGNVVNIEFDIIGKYVSRIHLLSNH